MSLVNSVLALIQLQFYNIYSQVITAGQNLDKIEVSEIKCHDKLSAISHENVVENNEILTPKRTTVGLPLRQLMWRISSQLGTGPILYPILGT